MWQCYLTKPRQREDFRLAVRQLCTWTWPVRAAVYKSINISFPFLSFQVPCYQFCNKRVPRAPSSAFCMTTLCAQKGTPKIFIIPALLSTAESRARHNWVLRHNKYRHARIGSTRVAVPRLRRSVAGLSPRRHGFDPGSVHVGFVVALVQVFPRVLRFSSVNFIPPVLHYTEIRGKKLIIFIIGLHKAAVRP
jgi:hypothetical protein